MSDDDLDELLASLTPEEAEALRLLARHESWRAGDLSYKMHEGQRRIWQEMHARSARRWVLEIGRKWGKTYFLVTVAAIIAMRKPKSRIVYGAPTLKHLEEFILPVLDEVAEDAPDDMRPVYNASSGHWTFPNGSWVHLFGADDKRKADRGRGPKAELAIFDEAGFAPVGLLNYVIKSIFRPSLMLSPGSWTLLSSTPAEVADHDFTRICEAAETNETLFHATFHDNPRLTDEVREEEIREAAKEDGMTEEEYVQSDDFRREYLAQRVTNKTLQVMGDDWEKAREGWKDPRTGAEIPKALVEWTRPQFFDAYEVIDWGGADPRAALFGFYDFANATLVVESEINLRNNENTAQLADAIKERERELYGVSLWDGSLRAIRDERLDERLAGFLPSETVDKLRKQVDAPRQPYIRVCDHDVQTAIDFYTLHKLAVVPADKIELRVAANDMRVAMRQGRIKVNPRCRDLDRQLRTSEWTSPRATDFKRKSGEHADLLWCLIYLWRSVRQQRNPTPANFGITDPVELMIRARQQQTPWKRLAGGRR